MQDFRQNGTGVAHHNLKRFVPGSTPGSSGFRPGSKYLLNHYYSRYSRRNLGLNCHQAVNIVTAH